MLTYIILILTCINQVLRYFGSDSRTPIYNYYLMKLCLHLGENQNNFLCSFNHFFIYVATNPKVLRTFTGKRKSKEKLRKEKNFMAGKLKNLIFHDNHRSLGKQC